MSRSDPRLDRGNIDLSSTAGYCVGPLAWGPLSEQYGRRPMFIIAFFFYTIFQVACAVAPNGEALLVFRFLSGCFAACPLTNSGAILADMYVPLFFALVFFAHFF